MRILLVSELSGLDARADDRFGILDLELSYENLDMPWVGLVVNSVRFPFQASIQDGHRLVILGLWSELASDLHIVLIAHQLRALVQVLITAKKCEIISMNHAPYLANGGRTRMVTTFLSGIHWI